MEIARIPNHLLNGSGKEATWISDKLAIFDLLPQLK